MNPLFNIFGSEDSVDYDVMIQVPEIPSISDSKSLCLSQDDHLKNILGSEKKINSNLAVIENGIIVKVFKGVPMECNNSIFRTYKYHRQYFPLFIERTFWDPSYPALKSARALRILLSFLSRTEHRTIVKEALRGNAMDKITTLRRINISDIKDFGKNNQDKLEINKTIAFQLGQTIAILDGTEIYTKTDIGDLFPKLLIPLKRKDTTDNVLDVYKDILLDKIMVRFTNLNETVKETVE